ncbi:MAG: sugar transferase [bacterium]|nr:sugar transferase [bacterium]
MFGSSKSNYIFAIFDALVTMLVVGVSFYYAASSLLNLLIVAFIFTFSIAIVLSLKGFYKLKTYKPKNLYLLFEGIFFASSLAGLVSIPFAGGFSFFLVLFDVLSIFVLYLLTRLACFIFKKIFTHTKNVLIVGAGQDGKLIAEEIQTRPELGLKVVGFLDDNMDSIVEEDSTIPILGLTYDSKAVIKDNNIDIVIIAVKSRMDSNILTDLAYGIPLGIKVWRMPTFYAHIAKKLYVSKMTVNWLFYNYVRPKHVIYSHVKCGLDKLAALAILLITLPITIIAMLIIKFSDFGPIFYTQTRIGKFGKPFRMVKFRTMYQDNVDESFDDDLIELETNDKRIMPFCKWMRNFHVDDIPQMINIIKGEMSLIGPRPVREDVYYKNKENIEFWECRNWVRPGWTGWQQIHTNNPVPEECLAYDLYYIRYRKLCWDICIFVKYVLKVISGKCS